MRFHIKKILTTVLTAMVYHRNTHIAPTNPNHMGTGFVPIRTYANTTELSRAGNPYNNIFDIENMSFNSTYHENDFDFGDDEWPSYDEDTWLSDDYEVGDEQENFEPEETPLVDKQNFIEKIDNILQLNTTNDANGQQFENLDIVKTDEDDFQDAQEFLDILPFNTPNQMSTKTEQINTNDSSNGEGINKISKIHDSDDVETYDDDEFVDAKEFLENEVAPIAKQNLIEKIDEKMDEKMDEKIDEKMDEKMDEKIDEKIDENQELNTSGDTQNPNETIGMYDLDAVKTDHGTMPNNPSIDKTPQSRELVQFNNNPISQIHNSESHNPINYNTVKVSDDLSQISGKGDVSGPTKINSIVFLNDDFKFNHQFIINLYEILKNDVNNTNDLGIESGVETNGIQLKTESMKSSNALRLVLVNSNFSEIFIIEFQPPNSNVPFKIFTIKTNETMKGIENPFVNNGHKNELIGRPGNSLDNTNMLVNSNNIDLILNYISDVESYLNNFSYNTTYNPISDNIQFPCPYEINMYEFNHTELRCITVKPQCIHENRVCNGDIMQNSNNHINNMQNGIIKYKGNSHDNSKPTYMDNQAYIDSLLNSTTVIYSDNNGLGQRQSRDIIFSDLNTFMTETPYNQNNTMEMPIINIGGHSNDSSSIINRNNGLLSIEDTKQDILQQSNHKIGETPAFDQNDVIYKKSDFANTTSSNLNNELTGDDKQMSNTPAVFNAEPIDVESPRKIDSTIPNIEQNTGITSDLIPDNQITESFNSLPENPIIPPRPASSLSSIDTNSPKYNLMQTDSNTQYSNRTPPCDLRLQNVNPVVTVDKNLLKNKQITETFDSPPENTTITLNGNLPNYDQQPQNLMEKAPTKTDYNTTASTYVNPQNVDQITIIDKNLPTANPISTNSNLFVENTKNPSDTSLPNSDENLQPNDLIQTDFNSPNQNPATANDLNSQNVKPTAKLHKKLQEVNPIIISNPNLQTVGPITKVDSNLQPDNPIRGNLNQPLENTIMTSGPDLLNVDPNAQVGSSARIANYVEDRNTTIPLNSKFKNTEETFIINQNFTTDENPIIENTVIPDGTSPIIPGSAPRLNHGFSIINGITEDLIPPPSENIIPPRNNDLSNDTELSTDDENSIDSNVVSLEHNSDQKELHENLESFIYNENRELEHQIVSKQPVVQYTGNMLKNEITNHDIDYDDDNSLPVEIIDPTKNSMKKLLVNIKEEFIENPTNDENIGEHPSYSSKMPSKTMDNAILSYGLRENPLDNDENIDNADENSDEKTSYTAEMPRKTMDNAILSHELRNNPVDNPNDHVNNNKKYIDNPNDHVNNKKKYIDNDDENFSSWDLNKTNDLNNKPDELEISKQEETLINPDIPTKENKTNNRNIIKNKPKNDDIKKNQNIAKKNSKKNKQQKNSQKNQNIQNIEDKKDKKTSSTKDTKSLITIVILVSLAILSIIILVIYMKWGRELGRLLPPYNEIKI